MVARPPVRLSVEPMAAEDIPAVHAIESASFPTPWPPYAFRQELETNRMARYIVVRAGQRVIAYAGIWLMADEAHMTTFAVLPAYRRRGIGGLLLSELMDLSADLGAAVITLEVRLSNASARRLYQQFGFRPVGVRPRYYSDDGEDALIMTTERLDAPDMQRLRSRTERSLRGRRATRRPRFRARRATRAARRMKPPSGRLLAVESSCDETAVAVVERGRRIVSSVVASQVALHSETGGIVPEVAARAHLRWMIPVLDEARRRADIDDWSEVDAVAVTEGPGLAGSLLVGITMAKTLAWSRGLPLVPVNHLEGHIYAAWLLDPGEAERPAPEFPLVAMVVSGGHTFIVEMVDHLHYRLLGQTVDDAAGEAFDKVGRLLGLPYPGGPAIMAGCRPIEPARTPLPACLDGRLLRLQLQRPQDGGSPRRR